MSSGAVHGLAVSLMEGTTGRQRIPASIFKRRLAAPVPSDKQEQRRIATVLSKVDETIAKIQASIDAAQKLKRGLMQNLLTGKLKPNGTWRRDDEFDIDPKFGRVPKGWEVKRVGDVFSVNEETLGAGTKPSLYFRYIELELVDTQQIQYEKASAYVFAEAPGRARRILKNGNFLFSTVRPNLLGFAKFDLPQTQEQWVGSTGLAVAQAKDGYDGDFIFYQLLGEVGQRQFHALVTGSNYPAINDTQFKKLKVLCPPYPEQQQISLMLLALDKTVIEKRKPKLERLRALKKALMQNLLTGKVRIPPALKIE
jgi:type I restriction enzyme S subunit